MSTQNYGYETEDVFSTEHNDYAHTDDGIITSYMVNGRVYKDKIMVYHMKYDTNAIKQELAETDNAEKVKLGFKVYGTGHMIGSNIYHAKTHEHIGYVGYNDGELFKVSLASGVSNHHGPVHLYYYGPKEYEKHHKKTLSPEIHQNWTTKQIKRGYEIM